MHAYVNLRLLFYYTIIALEQNRNQPAPPKGEEGL